MKAAILFLAFAFVAISSVSGFSTCSPPNVNDPVFPKQYVYNKPEEIKEVVIGYHIIIIRVLLGVTILKILGLTYVLFLKVFPTSNLHFDHAEIDGLHKKEHVHK